MIEHIRQINRIYANEQVLHTYKTIVDPKTGKETHEHLICRVYDKQANIKETDFKHQVDKLA